MGLDHPRCLEQDRGRRGRLPRREQDVTLEPPSLRTRQRIRQIGCRAVEKRPAEIAANALAADGHPVDPDDLATIAPYIIHTIRRFGGSSTCPHPKPPQ